MVTCCRQSLVDISYYIIIILYYYYYTLHILVPLFSCDFHLYCTIVFVFAWTLVLVEFMFSISYVTNLALWLRDFNKLTYLQKQNMTAVPACVSSLLVPESSSVVLPLSQVCDVSCTLHGSLCRARVSAVSTIASK